LEVSGRRFSAKQVGALAGKPLSALGKLPFAADCKILEATPIYHGGVALHLQLETQLVNCDTRRIRDR
jgi:hypothetical protein